MFTFCNFASTSRALTHSLVVNMHFFLCIFQHIFWQQFFFSGALACFLAIFFNEFMYFFSLYYCYAQPQIWFVNNNCTKIHFLFRAPTDSRRCFIFGIKNMYTSLEYFFSFSLHHCWCIHVCFHKIWQLFIRAKNFYRLCT